MVNFKESLFHVMQNFNEKKKRKASDTGSWLLVTEMGMNVWRLFRWGSPLALR